MKRLSVSVVALMVLSSASAWCAEDLQGEGKTSHDPPKTGAAESGTKPSAPVESPGGDRGKDPGPKKNEVPTWESVTRLSLQDLMNVEVTSITRSKGVSHFAAPAAIEVITDEDIRRTGHQHLPEILRLSPGMHVAQVNGNTWLAAARGFSGIYNRFQLVQFDGRSLYTPLFSGVYWNLQDYILEDIQKVEVIRGPGTTVWGANAVNGIVNFESKKAKDTQGLLVTAGGGTYERAQGAVRFGGNWKNELFFRVYGKYQETAEMDRHAATFGPPTFPTLDHFHDDQQRIQGGFRMDWEGKGADSVTFQGDVARNKYGAVGLSVSPDFPSPSFARYDTTVNEELGWNLLTRWEHRFSANNVTTLRIYHDRLQSDWPYAGNRTKITQDMTDVDFKHNISLAKCFDFVWGLNYRRNEVENTFDGITFTFNPTGDVHHDFGAFVQGTVNAIPEKLSLILGSKLDYNATTAFEIQPSAKLVFHPVKNHVFWWSYSRAVREPNFIEDNGYITQRILPLGAPPNQFAGPAFMRVPNPHQSSEVLNAFEFGYRTKPLRWFSLDVTAYYNLLDDFVQLRPMDDNPFLQQQENRFNGVSEGVELSATWQYFKAWRLKASYSYLNVNLEDVEVPAFARGVQDDSDLEMVSPKNMFQVRSYWDIRKDLELNCALYWYDNCSSAKQDSYTRLDVGVTWRPPVKNLEVELWGQNLINPGQVEYLPERSKNNGASIERGFFGKIRWRF